MTDLVLSQDSKQYQDLARDFSGNEIASRAEKADHAGKFQADICNKAWDIGLLNVRMPETLGGLALSAWDACVIMEEIGAGCTGIGAAFEANETAVALLMVAGSEEQQSKYLQPLTEKYGLVGYALDVFSPETSKLTYKKEGDRFVLQGPTTILNGSIADWFVVRAVDGASAENSLFIVPGNTDSIKKEKMETLGRKAADYCSATFDGVSVQTSALLGTEGDAENIAKKTQAHVYPLIAAEAVGIARSALQNAIKYAKERHTFGQPIANYQAVNFMMAEMSKDTEAARLMAWKAALATDNGDLDSDDHAQAKLFASDIAMKAATDAVQIYGGYGYSREYPVEKLMRDAKMLQIHLHNSHEMKVEIGKKVLAGAGCS